MIIAIIAKNLKIIFRNPFTLLLLILTPILLMLIVGYTYSGNTLSGVNVGFIETENNLFKLKGVEPKYFNTGNYTQSLSQCIKELNESKVEICVFFNPITDSSGELISAQTIYYVDNTRPQISDIIIRNFDYTIEDKTKEIATRTVEDIFVEVKDTVNFMKEGKNLTDEIQLDLQKTQKSLKQFEIALEITKTQYDKSYNSISSKKDNINNQLTTLDNSLDKLRDDLKELNSNLDDSKSDLTKATNTLSTTISGLILYAQTNPDINNYVNINNLQNTLNNLDDIEDQIQQSQTLTNEIINEIDSIDDISETNQMFNEVFDEMTKGKEYLTLAQTQLSKIIEEVNEKEQKLSEINQELGEKIDYFEGLSNKQASQITDPITKKYEPIFNNFKRIHQLTPTVIVLILLFIGLLLSNVIVSLEINSKAYFRNLISPVKQRKFIIALFFTSLIIILFQVLFLFLVLNLFFKIPINSNLIHLVLIIGHSLFIFILIGILLAYLFNSIQISILVTTFTMLFMFLLSDIIVPLEIMPTFIGNILQYNPVIFSENLIRLVIWFENTEITTSTYFIFYPYIITLITTIFIASNRRQKRLF